MTAKYDYIVAGNRFRVILPAEQNAEALLPSFAPFRCALDDNAPLLFSFAVTPDAIADADSRFLEDSVSELGRLSIYECPHSYRVEICRDSATPMHRMAMDKNLATITANIHWDDIYAGAMLTSMLRIAYSLAILLHDGISVHASAVMWQGKAYLFMGKSGTGKSTHARLWLQAIAGCELLNDDNPTIRIVDGRVIAYGTPWSGKTPCYKNLSCEVGGIVRLSQAPFNRFAVRNEVEAFTTILPGCASIRSVKSLNDAMHDTLIQVASLVTVGTLQCLPDADAAVLCARSLTTPSGE